MTGDWLDVEWTDYVVTLRRGARTGLFYCKAINAKMAAARAEQCNRGCHAESVELVRAACPRCGQLCHPIESGVMSWIWGHDCP